jgi:hypothetical protein
MQIHGASLLASDPSDISHAGKEQVLDVVLQNSLGQAVFPQMQSVLSLLGAGPSVFVQAEAVTPEA